MKPITDFRRTPEPPGGAFLPAGADSAGIAQKTVLHFLGRGFLQTSQNALFCRDQNVMFLLQILCDQGLQENKTAGAVGEGVEEFHSDAVFPGDDPEGTLPRFPGIHPCKGIAVFLRNWGCVFQLLQIVPKDTFPQPGCNGGKTPGSDIQRGLQHGYIHRFRQGGGKAEDVTPVVPPGGGINFGCVVQFYPPELVFSGHVAV